jgi:hypothetical protein
MRSSWALVPLLMAVSFAGCAEAPETGAPDTQDFESLQLKATDTTGLIRGVVVDEAIRPLANATVVLQIPSAPRQIQTGPDGLFGFDGLDPGTYLLRVSRFGFSDIQQTAEVVANVPQPPIVKVVLFRIPGLVAFVEAFVWDGFMECGTNNLIACAGPNAGSQIVCSVTSGNQPPVPPTVPTCLGNLTNDEFTIFHDITAGADHLQSELVWDSTQALGDRLALLLRYGSRTQFDGGFYNGSLNRSEGSSPVYATVNATDLEDADVGITNGLVLAIFPGRTEATVGQPVGFGAAVAQRWTTYTHAFHNYMPPVDWRFTADSTVPPPPR